MTDVLDWKINELLNIDMLIKSLKYNTNNQQKNIQNEFISMEKYENCQIFG